MADSKEAVEVTSETIRWIIGGGFLVLGAIIKLEFNRIWKRIDEHTKLVDDLRLTMVEKQNNSTIELRVEMLENSVNKIASMYEDTKNDRQKLFGILHKMNEKLHAHIESASEKKDMATTQQMRDILKEEISKLR